MLASFVRSERNHLQLLALAWQSLGAATFGISSPKGVLAQWPPNGLSTPSLRAPICVGASQIGMVWVAGVTGSQAQVRLDSDAALIAQILRREVESESVVGDLVAAQDQLLALYDLNRSLRNHLDVDSILGKVALQTRRMIDSDYAVAAIVRPDGSLAQAPSIAQYPSGFACEGPLHAWLRDAAKHPNGIVSNHDMSRIVENARSGLWVAAPIDTSQVAVLGWLRTRDNAFASPQIKLGQALVEQAAARIESALLHEASLAQARIRTELDLARSIQLRLLPQTMPRMAGLEIAAATLPALEVGGDFYDAIGSSKGPLAFAVGDVSGKGMSAALVMSMMRMSFRTKARFGPNLTAAQLLGRASLDMDEDLTELGMFCTAFVGRIDPLAELLTYANAGHSPVVFRPANGSARLLEADDPPLGVMVSSEFTERSLTLYTGDVLIVASDGLNEARNSAGELFGYEQLLQTIDELASKPAQIIVDTLFARIGEFSNRQPQSDDQTVLVIKKI